MDNVKPSKIIPRRERNRSECNAEPADRRSPEKGTAAGLPPLFGTMNGLMRVAAATDLTKPADPDWRTVN